MKSSGYEVFKTVLAFENWLENGWEICSQSGQPLNLVIVEVVFRQISLKPLGEISFQKNLSELVLSY